MHVFDIFPYVNINLTFFHCEGKYIMGRKRGEFGQYVDTGNKCIFCGHRIPGASMIKFHLAKGKGEGICACNIVPKNVQNAAASTIDNNSSKRVKQSRVSNDSNENIMNSNFPSDSWSSRGMYQRIYNCFDKRH